jgi:hypothetical protein
LFLASRAQILLKTDAVPTSQTHHFVEQVDPLCALWAPRISEFSGGNSLLRLGSFGVGSQDSSCLSPAPTGLRHGHLHRHLLRQQLPSVQPSTRPSRIFLIRSLLPPILDALPFYVTLLYLLCR